MTERGMQTRYLLQVGLDATLMGYFHIWCLHVMAFSASFFHALLTTLSLSILLCSGVDAHAEQDTHATEQVKVRLVSAHSQVHPGSTITVGLHQDIQPHWHTYWQNPGDSGVATRIGWNFPTGGSASGIQWPLPQRIDTGPITNYAYSDQVTLLTDIQVPKTAKPGSSFAIEAQVNWLVCNEVCIPQNATLRLNLPVADPDIPLGPEHALISQARKHLPSAAQWPVNAISRDKQIELRVPVTAVRSALPSPNTVTSAVFYPHEWGHVDHQAAQTLEISDQYLRLQLDPGEAPAKRGQVLSGVLVLTSGTGANQARHGFVVQPVVDAVAVSPSTPSESTHGLDVLTALVFALLGGVVLNLMPCVFPVLSIKAISLLQHQGDGGLHARRSGLAYTLGVLASFAALALVLVVLKAAGAQVGWGFQFHSPVFVLIVAYLMLAVGLNLSGVFTIGYSVTGLGQSLAQKTGYAGSFFTGVLATVVATPCTAPFMGGAIGFALTQSPVILVGIFLSLGLGLALPYLLLSYWPALQNWLPKPGIWMERFKQLLAFPMYGAAAWLVWVLAQQTSVNAVGVTLLGMVGIAFAAWLYNSMSQSPRPWLKHATHGVVLAVLGGAIYAGYVSVNQRPSDALATQDKTHEPYTKARFDALRAQGEPVFLNFTAAWCITCLANERVALSSSEVQQLFQTKGIHYLKGDWTNQDPQISDVLQAFGRSGVPLYVYYPKGSNSSPLVLPQLLTPASVIQAIEVANSSSVVPLSSSPQP